MEQSSGEDVWRSPWGGVGVQKRQQGVKLKEMAPHPFAIVPVIILSLNFPDFEQVELISQGKFRQSEIFPEGQPTRQ